jgi:hypothetical protein
MVFEEFPQLLQTLRLRFQHERSNTMNTRKVIITAALIASLSMLAFAQQQRQAGNSQGATPQVQAQLQQQDAVCPNGGEFAEDATRTQTRAQAHDPANAPAGAPLQVQQQVRDPSTHE